MTTSPGTLALARRHYEEGDRAQAERICRHILQGDPGDAAAHDYLAMMLLYDGRIDEAVAHCRRVVQIKPESAGAHNNLGYALAQQGDPGEALACYRRALELAPFHTLARINLARTLVELREFEEAAAQFREAWRLQPDSAEKHIGLGDALTTLGEIDEAYVHYQEALRLRPADRRLEVMVSTSLPLLYDSMEHLAAVRQWYAENIGRLHERGVRLDLTEKTAFVPFYLAYQGSNNRDLRRELAGLYSAPMTESITRRPAATEGKIKVGFISACFKDHTVGRLMHGLIARLSRDRVEVTTLSTTNAQDDVARLIRQSADRFVAVPGQLPEARQRIAELGLDVLFYTDLGMEPFTFTLAFSRLAPVQCATWGHPETTGLETIDYFVSSELFESAEADEHYTEKLVRLKTLPAYAYRPAPAPMGGREQFGFSDDCHLYFCLQNVFKFHPEFDALLGDILRRDRQGVLVLSQGWYPRWEGLLRSRFQRTLPDVLDRIRWLPWLGYDAFLEATALADVVLDPVHFGGGRTSYEALGLGVPIVTLPSPLLKGRMTLAMYRKMGVLDCVARSPEEYVDLAVRLGTNPNHRAAIRGKILAANEALFEDQEAVRELERFFEEAVGRPR